jgi:hypothetical protein|tara:strand:+ start:20243 stop:20473 length:231 start_codon:yes stop_codon:yes gene_type:complete
MNCQHCNKDNKGGWFYCKSCGGRAHPPKFTTNSWMRSDITAQSKMEFSVQSMDDSVKKMNDANGSNKLKQLGINPL